MTAQSHLSLSQLLGSVRLALEAAFPLPVWVAAEIADLRVNASSGHCYIELVEKGAGAVPRAQARAVVWRGQWTGLAGRFREATGSAPAPGMKVLVRATVGYHELYGFSLTVSDIDPAYTLGERERQRRQTIARLHEDGVWDMNREVGFGAVVQRVAVVSAAGAAGWRDFWQELGRSAYRFEVTLFEAVMQGLATEGSVVEALERIAERSEEFDAVVILRGGGSASDLSAFDGYRLAAHVAQFPLPVATAIGHDKDRSVADMVAALELKTPTAAAVWLAEGLARFDASLTALADDVYDAALDRLSAEKLRLERLSRVVSTGATGLTRQLEMRLERLSGDVVRLSGALLQRETLRLTGFEGAVSARRPENILALGFAIVRSGGRAVKDPASLTDQPFEITLAKGKINAIKQ